MASCLGIYLSNNIIKYAKLSLESSSGNIKLEQSGVRFIKGTQKETLVNIIEETNSQNIPIVMNPQNDNFINYQMFDQVQNKNIATDIAKMEFEAWCEKNAKSPDKYSYVYQLAEVKNSENKFNAVLNFIDKKYLDEYADILGYPVNNIYPAQFLMTSLVNPDDKNYMLVNLDNELSISVMVDGKLYDEKFYNVGMKRILFDFAERLGSYQKAYEACKQLNVYTEEGSTNNDKQLEHIAEPILQEVLRDIAMLSTRYKTQVEKIYLAGTGIVFTNIDILIREYVGIKCEILKPALLQDTSNVRNMAEILETTQAMALAHEFLLPKHKSVAYLDSNTKLKNTLSKLFSGKPLPKKPKPPAVPKGEKPEKVKKEKVPKEEKKKNLNGIEVIEDKSRVIAICAAIVLGVTLISYITFSTLYISNVNGTIKKINKAKDDLTTSVAQIKTDTQYITKNKEEYKAINDEVKDVVDQIQNNKIGKFTTYNVASFLQNIIKIIPKNVQLSTISSDDNKNVKIVAQSNSYADLGYFIAELKLNNTLNNIKINSIKNGETTVIEIGGELP